MAKLVRPILFTQHFRVNARILDAARLIDPILNSDTKLFIDPLLIRKSTNAFIRRRGVSLLENQFRNVLDLLDTAQTENDSAWKAAFRILDLNERPETGLGYGGASTSGSSRPRELREKILRTAKEIITLGEKNPHIIPLMGLFEEGVGPDTLSDMTTNFLMPVLCELTESFSSTNGIAVRQFGTKYDSRRLPENPFHQGRPIVLLPRDLLRDLPLATDWADVSRVVFEIREIREAVNRMLGDITKASVVEKKRAIRNAALGSLKNLRKLLNAIMDATESYDQAADLDGLYTFRRILSEDRNRYKGLVKSPAEKTQETLHSTVRTIVEEFTKLVEDNNLWELLWYGTKPRHERAAQLLFFSVANVLCAVNDVDISPETNSGGGPVDFKFSTGFRGRVLVELKLSTGQVVHGYTKQLERYKRAAKTEAGIFVVVDVGRIEKKLQTIQRLQKQAEARGETVSQIAYVDARRQLSASRL